MLPFSIGKHCASRFDPAESDLEMRFADSTSASLATTVQLPPVGEDVSGQFHHPDRNL